jgi:hypothetical protein
VSGPFRFSQPIANFDAIPNGKRYAFFPGKPPNTFPGIAFVNSDRGQVVFHGAGQSAVTRIGQQDRLAIGGKQRPQLHAGRDFTEIGETAEQFVARDLAQISDRALAEMGEFAIGHGDRFSSGHFKPPWREDAAQGHPA